MIIISRTARLTSTLALGALLLTGGVSAAANPGTAGNPTSSSPGADPRTCSLDDAQLTATASVAQEHTELFTSYAATGQAWTGADSTYSVPLEDGTTAWIFSDTFLGPVNDDGTRPETTPFLNNSIVLQEGADLSTITGGTEEEAESILGPTEEVDWHWFGAGHLARSGDLQIGALGFTSFGEDSFDFEWHSNTLASLDTSTWEVTDVDPLPSESGVQWASWYQRLGGHVYVYGVEDAGEHKYMHVARVLGGDLSDLKRWRYWDGQRWSTQETDSVRIMSGVANEYSVTPYRDGYLLITQDTSIAFSPEIRAYTACSPVGPFTGGTELYQMPEIGPDGSYGNPNVIAYNAHEHPHLRSDDTLLVTYNVNSMDPDDLYADVSIYHPRFIEVELGLTDITSR